MNAERRAWSFEQWTEYFFHVDYRTLVNEVLTERTIDLNHRVTSIAEDWVEFCTVLGILAGVHAMVAAYMVISNPALIDWNAAAIQCNSVYGGKPAFISGMPVAVLLDSGCMMPSMFKHFDPCSVAKKIPGGILEQSGLECYVENACKHKNAGLVTDMLLQQYDALPMPVLQVMAFEAQKTQTAGSLMVLTHIQAHIRWREENMARQRVALWLGGDVSKKTMSPLWNGNALGEAIATRMQYSYKEYMEEQEEEARKNGQREKRRKILD